MDVDLKCTSCAYSGRVKCKVECVFILCMCDLVHSSDVHECHCVNVKWVYGVYEWNVSKSID